MALVGRLSGTNEMHGTRRAARPPPDSKGQLLRGQRAKSTGTQLQFLGELLSVIDASGVGHIDQCGKWVEIA
jgi:hypothetical protein